MSDGDGNQLYLSEKPPSGKRRHVRIGTGETIVLQPTWDTTTVWEVGRDHGIDHPTPKPLELIRRAVENSTRAGDIITDPFLGSGSTLIAAHLTGRRCYGIEKDPKYVDVVLERWAAQGGEPPRLEVAGE